MNIIQLDAFLKEHLGDNTKKDSGFDSEVRHLFKREDEISFNGCIKYNDVFLLLLSYREPKEYGGCMVCYLISANIGDKVCIEALNPMKCAMVNFGNANDFLEWYIANELCDYDAYDKAIDKNISIRFTSLPESVEDAIHKNSPDVDKMRFISQHVKDDEVLTETDVVRFCANTIGRKYITHNKKYLRILINEFTKECKLGQWYEVKGVKTTKKTHFGTSILVEPIDVVCHIN